MTCEQVRGYFEDHLPDAEVRSNRGAVAQHVSTCADCARHVEEQRALGRSLRLVRKSAPAVPEPLDAAVLARYQQYVAQSRQTPSTKRGRWLLPSGVWALSAVAASVLAMAAFWFFSPSHRNTGRQASTSNPAGSVPVAQDSTVTPAGSAAGSTKHGLTGASKTYHRKTARRPAEIPVREARSLPEGFRSLMYCDALSCPGEMDMIRVQLPASAMSRQVPGFIQTSGSVTADVLVGPDGIARGIRFEEIEF